MGNFLDSVKNKKVENNKNTSASTKKVGKFGKSVMESKIGLDTLEDDLKSLGTTVESIYTGWQPQETMNNTKASVVSMQERLNAYQEYAKLFGGNDVTELANGYKAILEDWDKRSTVYGQYKNADAYNAVKKNVQLEKQFSHEDGSGYTFDEVQAELKKYAPDSDEYKYLSTYTNYSDLNDFYKAMGSDGILDVQNQIATLKAEKEKLDSDYKASGGWVPSASHYNRPSQGQVAPYQEWQAKSSELENKIKTLEDSGYLGELKTKKNLYELEHKVDLFKPEYEGKADFEEKSKYVTTYNENKKTNIWTGPLKYENLTYEYINNVDGARDEIQAWDEALNKDGNGYESEWQKKGYDLLREDEIRIYNYKHSEEGEESANQFLEEMAPVLNKRRTDKLSEGWEQNAEKLPILSNAATVLLKPAGAIVGAIDDAVNAVQGEDYNPYSYAHTISNFVSNTRKYTGEDIEEKTKGVELFGQNIPSFLYNTGMSVADSVYGVASVGKFNSVLMGTSAFQDKAKEMVESGAEQDVVWKSAITSGVAETLFEHIGIDNLFKIKNVDSLSSLVKNALKQAGAEGFEEIGTEITNIIADDVIRGKDSELYKMYNDLIKRGYSESEALSKTALKAGSQVAWAGIGGALSGAVMGGFAGAKNYGDNKTIGKEIRGNERVTDMLNIASLSPQESDVYAAYTEYAKQGVNAENITDAQLGNLYGMAEADARGVLASKKSSLEQRQQATETTKKLSDVYEKGTLDKETIDRIDRRNTYEEGLHESADLFIQEGLESAENTDSFKLATKFKERVDNGEKLSTQEILKLQNANTKAIRQEELAARVKNMPKAEADLFLKMYDGKSDVDEFGDSFNLVLGLAQNKLPVDYILERRGVLSPKQVNAIQKEVVLNPLMAKQKNLNEIVKQQGDNLEIQGTIDDSAIDYDNTGADGKVNWDDIHPNTKATIALISGFSVKSAGMDVKLVTNGREHGFVGQYHISKNTVYIDINAVDTKMAGADTKGRHDNSRVIINAAAHEFTHWMEEKAPELYAEYSKMVLDTLTSGSKTLDDLITERKEKLDAAEERREAKAKKEGKEYTKHEYTPDEIMREIVARASEDMLALSEEGKRIFESLSESDKKQFANKIQEIFHNIMDWINNVLSTLKSSSPEAKLLRELAEDITAISKKWDEMLRQAAKANAAMKKAGVNDKAIMESKASNTQNADIDTYTAAQYNNFGWVVVNKVLTGKELKKLYSQFAKVKLNKEYNFKNKLGEYLIPVGDRYGSIDKIVYIKGTNKHPIIRQVVVIKKPYREYAEKIVVEVMDYEATGLYYDAFEIYESYAREEIFDVHKAIDYPSYSELKRGTRGQNGKRTHGNDREWNNRTRVLGNRTGEVRSKDGGVSNSDIDSEGNKLTAEQKEYFKDSVIRNANGNLMPMYHGTEHGGFTVFGGRKDYWYFSNSKKYSYTFAGRKKNGQFYPSTKEGIEKGYYNSEIYKVYLDVKNPFVTDDVDVVEYALYWDKSLAGKLREQGYDALMLEDMSQVIVLNANQIKRVDNKLPTVDPDIRYSDIDTEYMDAVDNGNVSTAQKMVDNAAKSWGAYSENGKPVKFSHGTKGKDFTVFRKGDIGFHFGTKEQAKNKAGHITPAKTANPFFLDEDGEIKTGRIIDAYLKMDNPLTFARDLGEWTVPRIVGYFEALLNNESSIEIEKYDRTTKNIEWEKVDPKEISDIRITEKDRAELESIKKQYERDALSHVGEDEKDYTYSSRSSEMLRNVLINKGYDSIKYLNEYEGKENDYSYAVFFSNQIKSADPITYDDNGNVIPLSKRFNANNEDIRYSDIDAEGNELSEGQIAFFKDSKVRNSQGALIPVYHGTVADFTIFDREFGNSEGDFGRGFYFTNTPEDVEINYANEEGPDLVNKIEHWADMHEDEFDSREDAVEAAREKYVTAEPHTIKAYLNMTNPVELFNSERGTYLDYEESYDEETDEYGEPEGLLIDFVEALQNNESNFDVWRSPDYWSILGDRIYDGGLYLVDAIQMLKNQIFEDIQDEEGNLALNELIRMALEDMGYDGIIDHTVSHKFKNMKGMSPATTHYIVFNSNQAKKTDNLTPTNDPDIRYSDIDELDDLNAQLKEKQNQIYSASMELRKFDSKAEEEKLYAVLQKEGASKEELDDALQVYAKWGEESGYADASTRLSALKDEEKLLRREIQKVEDRLHDELKEQIAHWDDEDVKKYVAKAVRKYHTTTRLDKASYLLTTGSMLDFSDGQGYRVKDHREISEILDLPDYAEYSDGMIAFMNMGNIRLQTYGIDVSAMPNSKQFTALRDIIFTVMRENDEFSVDFSKTDGYSAGSVTYGKGTSASKIIADIKSYFETGVVPEEQSSIRDFLYSDIDVEVDIYEVLGENKRLNKENKTLREDFERLMERMKLEKQVTHGKHLNENQLDIVAGHIRNLGKSNYSKPDLINKLRDVYTYIATSDEVTWDNLFARLYGIAEDVLDVERPTYSPNDYYANIYRDMRNTEISLSDEQKKYVKDMLGVDWHKAFFGKIKVSDTGTPLNSKWEEWAGKYPNEFAETQDKDQVLALLDIYETAKELKEVVEEYDKVEQTRWLANEIYNQYWNVSAIRTTADKYDKQIKRLNYEHRNAMKELRDSYNERMKKANSKIHSLKKSRDKWKNAGKKMIDKYKEDAKRKTRIQSITAQALTLNEWLVKNSKDKHIHESMKGPVVALLQAIDFSSKRALGMWGGDMKGVPTSKDISLQKALSQVQKMMADASVGKEELVLLYGHELDADIEAMIESVDSIMRAVGDNEFILNKMTLDDLITLDNVVKTIKHAVTQMNKFHIVNHAKGIANLAQEEIVYAEKLGKEKIYKSKSLKAGAKKLLAWKNINPYYAFKRFGAAGKKIFEAFQDGYDKFAFNIKEIIDFTNSTYNAKEVQDWEKEIKSFKLRMPATENELSNPDYEPQYQEIKMTVAQIMDLYLLNKREAARVHLLGGGIRVADIETKGSEVISQAEGALLEQSEIDQIIKTLTPRQIEVADALSHFMNTTSSDWGNEVSMARFGYKAFGEKNYVPMQVDKNNLAVDDETEKNNSLFRLLNMSFTKALTENASNRLVVSSIFDVFAQHTSDMAKYNALALPVLDAFRWYNYKEKGFKGEMAYDTKSVKQAIENAFGKDGQSYITTFLKDLNGQENTSRDTIGKGFFTKAKIAAVGANIRVALLQPTAYLKASANIDSKYLIRALGHRPKIGRAEKYCGMALWKSLGYFDTNVQRGVADQIKHAETKYDKAVELSMKGAEWGDKITFGYLWNAAELEIREKRQDLKVGSDEFYLEVGKRLRDIIYSTQVVDSVMTRSEMMRSPDWGDKLITTFASEPTIAYSMLSDAYFQTQLDARELGSKKAAIKKNAKHMARVVVAYTTTNLVAALVESGFDVLRDDDDEEMDMAEFMKLYLENFATNQSITAKIPWLKEAVSILQGFTSTRMDTQWIQTFSNTLKQVAKLMQGEGNPTKLIKNGLQTISYAFGLPFYNAYRDLMASLNKLGILTTEELEEILKDFIE